MYAGGIARLKRGNLLSYHAHTHLGQRHRATTTIPGPIDHREVIMFQRAETKQLLDL